MTSDEQAIANVIAEYARLVDSGEHDAAARLWATDGAMSFRGSDTTGHDAIASFLAGSTPGKHLNGIAAIWIDGATARACTAFCFWRGSDLELSSVGRYEDELVKAPEGWRFSHRAIVIEYP